MKDINEIQLIGGSMSYSFIVDIIKETFSNSTVIRKEFDQTNTISQGGVYFGMQVNDALPFPQCNFTHQHLYDLTLTCSQDHNLCTNGNCETEIREPGKPNRMITIKGNISALPRGSSNIYDDYQLTNVTNITFTDGDNPYGLIHLSENQDLLHVQWCKNEGECYNVSYRSAMSSDILSHTNVLSYELYASLRSRDTKQDKVHLLFTLLEEVDSFIRKFHFEGEPKLKRFQDFYSSIKGYTPENITSEIMEKASTAIHEAYSFIEGLRGSNK